MHWMDILRYVLLFLQWLEAKDPNDDIFKK